MLGSGIIDFYKKSIWNDLSLGPTVGNIRHLLLYGNRDNANMAFNPEMQHKYVGDEPLKKFALIDILTGEEAEFHINGYGHAHDLEFFAFRPLNCLQHDLRFFIRNGLAVDGTKLHTSYAKGAKNLFTLINHIGQILGAGQINMSGGQSIPFINTFLTPYTFIVTDAELKQAIQMLIFNINMSYVSRGGQSVFSTINVDLEMPEFLKKEPVEYAGDLELPGTTYGDFQDEAKRIAHMIIEVLIEGDGNGKPHLFPNTVFQINDNVDLDEWDDVFELSAKFSLAYFNKPIDGHYALVMGCRTRLTNSDAWTGDWEEDLIRTGNLAYCSLNISKYALRATGIKDKRDFWQILDYNLSLAKSILVKRREQGEFCLNKLQNLQFLSQKDIKDGRPYYKIENSTLSFGIVGLHEAVKILNGGEYDDALAVSILEHINKYATQLKEETGYRWTVIASPAESTAGKFGIINKRKYGDRSLVNGTTGAYYCTNGTHIPVNSDLLLPQKIKIEAPYHKLTQGGNILNLFMGEAWSDAGGLKSLTKKIYANSDAGFWTYSSILALCKNCHSRADASMRLCVNCGAEGEDIELYDRITGYVQRVHGWNDSKQAEFKDRIRY